MTTYILDQSGFMVSVFEGKGAPANSTNIDPPKDALLPLRFLAGAWLAPAPAITWDNAKPEYFWIDVGPFFDRFGAKALPITSSADPVVRGMVTLLLPRKYVDLKRPDLPQLLAILVEKAIINQEEMQLALNMRTTEHERHIKGLQQPVDAEGA